MTEKNEDRDIFGEAKGIELFHPSHPVFRAAVFGTQSGNTVDELRQQLADVSHERDLLRALLKRVIDSSVLAFEQDGPEEFESLEADICAALKPSECGACGGCEGACRLDADSPPALGGDSEVFIRRYAESCGEGGGVYATKDGDLCDYQHIARLQAEIAEKQAREEMFYLKQQIAENKLATALAEIDSLKGRYNRDVNGLNNEGDPIGGDPAGGYANDLHSARSEIDQLKAQRDELQTFDIDSAARKLANCMDYPWEYMPEAGRNSMRSNAKAVIDAALSKPAGSEQE